MKNVLFLSADNINGQTGAAKFARLLISQPERWEKHGYCIKCFSNSGSFSDALAYSKSLKHKVKQKVKSLLGKTGIGRRIRFFNYYVGKLGAVPVDKCGTYLNDCACVIFNDLWVAWNFYQKYGGSHRTIFIMHNSGDLLSMLRDEMVEKRIDAFLKNCEATILKNATRIVFVSETARKYFITAHPEYIEKTRTIYIGMDDVREYIPDQNLSVRFVTVGTVCKRKNQILAIEALESLGVDNVTLTVVGGGPALEECREYVKLHELNNQVVFTGATDRVGEVLGESNVFLMTSKDEGLPVAAQEAMAAGLPLILTDVGGCSELIDNNGLLIHPVLDEVVAAMRFFIEKPEMIDVYGKESCSLFQKRFSLEKMQEGYIDLVQEVST